MIYIYLYTYKVENNPQKINSNSIYGMKVYYKIWYENVLQNMKTYAPIYKNIKLQIHLKAFNLN